MSTLPLTRNDWLQAPDEEVVSPELCLVDPDLAARARVLLRPCADPAPAAKTVRPPGRPRARNAGLRRRLIVSLVFGCAVLGFASIRDAMPTREGIVRRPRPAQNFHATTTPLRRRLTWRRVPHASYYDVILTRQGRRLLDLWPAEPHATLPRTWTSHGNRYRLRSGDQWFVYPGFGSRPARRYGRVAAAGVIARS